MPLATRSALPLGSSKNGTQEPRVTSGTDIYHVMLRGINRQDIFEDQEDYVRFLTCMQQMLEPYDDLGNRLPPLCTFYAYCLMSNHVHLLIKTHHEDIGATIKHLAVVYAMYFNHKYSRAGHLFQDRFKSEPVRSSSADIAESRQRSSIAQTLEIQALEKEQRNQNLLSLLDLGAGFRQISRITGVPYGVIHRLSSKR